MQPAGRHRRAAWPWIACLGLVGVLVVSGLGAAPAGVRQARAALSQDSAPQPKTWRIVARKYTYSPPRIEVQQNDLVQITLETSDIPHSFTIDEPYRIAKRATQGHPIVFEFRAERAGTFTFYCNLAIDDGCRKMKGELVVKPAR